MEGGKEMCARQSPKKKWKVWEMDGWLNKAAANERQGAMKGRKTGQIGRGQKYTGRKGRMGVKEMEGVIF